MKLNILIIVLLLVVIIGLGLFNYRKRKQYAYYKNKKLREKKLDEQLKNSGGSSKKKQYHSYRTDYYEEAGNLDKGETCLLIEKTEYTKQVFLLQKSEEAYFARENDSLLVLEEMSGEELICKINYKQGYWCIKSFGAVPVYVIRGIVKKRINGKGIILENGDKILILNSEFKFTN